MEIKMNPSVDPIARLAESQRRRRTDSVSGDLLAFGQSQALDRALQESPDIRSEAVARARRLVADPDYPSADTLQKLGGLLADHIEQPE